MHTPLLPLLALLVLLPGTLASFWSFNQTHLLDLQRLWTANTLNKRYVTDSQIDAWISGSGPFPYYYQPTYSPSSVSSCNSNENQFPGPSGPSSEHMHKRDDFVTRSGSKLFLDGFEFRPVGPNIYWLGLDENVVPNLSYPSQTRVWEMMGIASAMGANAIRAHTLGISFGNSLSVVTGPNTYNDGAYQAIDFAIMAARVYGLKLIIPLVDNYNWYHGGKYQFVGWAGHTWSGTGADITPPDVGGFFYNDTTCIQLFMDYIQHHLTHVNQYTGIALKDDPTIMIWETGNELSVYQRDDGPPPNAWTQQICALIKSLAPNHLCMDGTFGIFPNSGQLSNSNVDALTDHFYPASVSRLQTGASYTMNEAGKVYIAGEWDWTGQFGGDDINSFMNAVQNIDGTGDFFWSLFGHDSDCCTLVTHNDGYTMYYPGTTSDMTTRASEIVNHYHSMTSNDPPQVLPRVACAATTVNTVPSSTANSSPTTSTASPTQTFPAGWTYSGCLAEPTQHSTSVRALTSYESTQSALINEWCVNQCNSMGYTLAGTENGNECYCGNTISSGGATTSSSNCNTHCSGASSETCGGSWTLSLYAKGATAQGWQSLGCYVDANNRALPSSLTSSSSMTVAICQSYCLSNGFNFAGVEDGNECWCSNSIQNGASAASSSDCSTQCQGNANEICGGGWRINIYQHTMTTASTPTSTATATSSATASLTGWSSLGCYVDANSRALPADATSSSSMTVESCESFCLSNGFALAGVENGNECWCANSIQNGATAASASDCSTSCSGNSNGSAEKCGGGWRINIHQYNAPTTATSTTSSPTSSPTSAGWHSVGCYVDANNRALPSDATSSNSMTIESCNNFCLGNGFALAGTEAGNECWCSNSIQNGATLASRSDCSTKCAGNSNEKCGGGWRINIYQYIPPNGPRWSSVGCYVDANNRALPNYAESSSSMTTEVCQSFCGNAGYSYAGTEDGNECWCANSIQNGATQASSADCSTPCVGNSGEICGGGWRLSIYKLSNSKRDVYDTRSRRKNGRR